MKLRTSKRIAAVTLTLLAAAQLAACGGGGGGGSTPPPSTTPPPVGGDPGPTPGGDDPGGGSTVTLSGKAADGYLAGATVCLDVNANMACDASEPTATTGAGGAFTLTIPTDVDGSAHPIVVQVSATTIDEDTGAAVGQPYVLSAPAGESSFISPLTTVVHGMLQLNPALTVDEAVSQVKSSIGAGAAIDLFEDYVAAKQDSSNPAADGYERLHYIAQITAKVIAENHEAVMEAAATQGIDTTASNAALLALVTSQALDELEGAALAVDSPGFDIDTVTVTAADVSNLDQQLEQVAEAASAAKISIESLLAQGIYWAWAGQYMEEAEVIDEYEYGFLQASSEAGRITETWSVYDTTLGWTELAPESAYYLTNGEWVLSADSGNNYAVTHQSDGSAVLDLDGADFSLKFSAAELDVSGKPIKDYLQYGYDGHELIATTIAGDPVFSSGAKVYQVNFIVVNDSYVLDEWQDCDVADSDGNGNCNVVWGYASNSTPGPVATLDGLLYPAGSPPSGAWFSVGDEFDLRLIRGDGQRGGIHITDHTIEVGQPGHISFGEWQYKTVDGMEMMVLQLPTRFTPRLWDSGQQILAVRDGYVRRGTFQVAGTAETIGELQFNETAFTDFADASSIYSLR